MVTGDSAAGAGPINQGPGLKHFRWLVARGIQRTLIANHQQGDDPWPGWLYLGTPYNEYTKEITSATFSIQNIEFPHVTSK